MADEKEKPASHPTPFADEEGFLSLLETSEALRDRAVQSKLADLFERFGGAVDQVLDELARQGPEGERVAGELRFTMSAGVIASDNLALVRGLQQLRTEGKLRDIGDLARFDIRNWMGVLRHGVNGKPVLPFPEDVPAEALSGVLDAYAREIADRVSDTMPMAVIRDRMSRVMAGDRDAQVAGFLARHTDFDFAAQPVTHYLKDHPEALDGARDPGDLTRQLQSMQRVFSVTPRYTEMRTLLDDGITSASKIALMGRNSFIELYGAKLGSAGTAAEIFDKAAHVTAAVTSVLYANKAFNKALPNFIFPNDVAEVPDWKELFGSLELCDCSDCRSLLSPAAYLVDLLHFLRLHKLVGPVFTLDAIDFLFARRGDIGHIELTCANTNTQLPYIDLVNEILENVVSPVVPTWNTPAITPAQQALLQTTRTTPELLAEPEHVIPGAYTILAARPYPWNLPFDLWTEMARSYLGLLGVKRYALFETLFAAPWSAALQDVDVAAEYLLMVPSEHAIIVGIAAFQPWEYWGYGSVHPTWANDQKQLRTFFKNSGLTYVETLDLLLTSFINPDRSVTVTIDSTCNLDTATINWTGEPMLGRVHRFVRLWRKLGWAMAETDQAIRSLTGGLLNDDCLLKLSHVQRLRAALNVPLPRVLSWWAPIDTVRPSNTTPSYYQELFQNRAVVGDPTPFALNAAGTELQVVGALNDPTLVPAVLAATGLSALDFALLTDSAVAASVLRIPASDITDNKLSLANLSLLYRTASFAHALSISVREVVMLRAITGLDPFNPLKTSDTLRFVEVANKVRDAGLSIPQLDYLLRDDDLGLPSAPLSDDFIAETLGTLRAALNRSADDMPADPAFDPGGTEARARRMNVVVQGLGDALNLDTGIASRLLTSCLTVPSAPAKAAIEAFFDPAFAGTVAITPVAFPDLFTLYRRLHKTAMMVGALKISARQVGWICDFGNAAGWLDPNALPVVPAVSGAALFPGLELLLDVLKLSTTLPSGEAALTLCFAAAAGGVTPEATVLDQLHDHLGWDRDDLDTLSGPTGFALAYPADFLSGLALLRMKPAFDLLRVLGVAADRALGWKAPAATQAGAEAIVKSVKTRYQAADWPPVARVARDYLRERQRASLVSAVLFPGGGAVSPWRDTKDLFDHFLIDVEMSPCQLTSRIKQAISSVQTFCQRVMLDLDTARIPSTGQREDWAQRWETLGIQTFWVASRQVLFFPEDWIEPELRDDKTPFFKDLENELLQNEITAENVETAYLHYLQKVDDVSHLQVLGVYEETDVMPNVGYGSVGQAVQDLQIQLNDNGAMPLLDEDGKFGALTLAALKDFQKRSGLLVDGIASASTWAALGSRLQNTEAVHVVGRTRGNPNIYYSRRRLGSGLEYWTPWERIDPDINVEQVLPMVWNGRPYLFWPVFADVAGPNSTDPHTWQVRMAWSEYRSGQWQAHKASADHPPTKVKVIPQNSASSGKDVGNGNRHHLFKTRLDGDQLLIGLEVDMKTLNGIGGVRTPIWFRFGGCARQPVIDTLVAGSPADLDPNDPLRPQDTEQDGMPFRVKTASGAVYLPTLAGGNTAGAVTLGHTSGTAYILTSHQDSRFTGYRPFLIQDDKRTFYVTDSTMVEFFKGMFGIFIRGGYVFEPFYHPYVCDFVARLNRGGIDALLQRNMQVSLKRFYFDRPVPEGYLPVTNRAFQPYPIDDVDFTISGAYSIYNWEVFFHVPLMIAHRLSANQQFEKARKWYHYIFDPMDTSAFPAPARYWRTRPFFEMAASKPVADLMRILSTPDAALSAADQLAKSDFRKQIKAWQQDPFNPHKIARLRLGAYQKNVVMKYLDNLIAWADQLFARDTIEEINQATQLYILAERILGPRPMEIPAPVVPTVQTYRTLEAVGLDELSNALVKGEDSLVGMGLGVPGPAAPPPALTVLAFCLPPNEKLLRYWDIIESRLSNIRNCRNLEGVERQLPLYDKPIDPAILVRAAAAGLDLGAVLNDLNAPQPFWRFNIVYENAMRLCDDVRNLGSTLLSIISQRNAEELARLQSDHEIALLQDMSDVRAQQVNEATDNLQAMQHALELAKKRSDYYSGIKHISAWEVSALTQAGAAVVLDGVAFGLDLAAATADATPYKTTGALGTSGTAALTTFEPGGNSLAHWAQGMRTLAGILTQTAAMTNTMALYDRRGDEWNFQADLAKIEIDQINRQIAAAEVRLAIANSEVENNRAHIDRAREVRSFLATKFTNQERFDVMAAQTSALYFQRYQLACDVARRAERAYRLELGLEDSNFIQFGYWDTLQKGLLAGDRLQHDLRRMQASYLDRGAREYEITKHISLLSLDPMALVKLRETGRCFIEIPEALFEMDFPGHYMRRIKALSLTIPCVTGPYTGVSATLTLLKSSIRKNNSLLAGKYARAVPGPDPRFLDLISPVQSIATSNAQSDSGLFELNFRDERLLPFEMAGAVSSWRLELSPLAQFDRETVTDVVFDMRLTSREGGAVKATAATELADSLNAMALADGRKGRSVLFSLLHRFPSEWFRFMTVPDPVTGDHVQSFPVKPDLFPFYVRAQKVKISAVHAIALPRTALPVFDAFLTPAGALPNPVTDKIPVLPDPTLAPAVRGSKIWPPGLEQGLGDWTLRISAGDFVGVGPACVDILLHFEYSGV